MASHNSRTTKEIKIMTKYFEDGKPVFGDDDMSGNDALKVLLNQEGGKQIGLKLETFKAMNDSQIKAFHGAIERETGLYINPKPYPYERGGTVWFWINDEPTRIVNGMTFTY